MSDPIRVSVEVPEAPEVAFRRFTTEVTSWWPLATQPVGQSRPQTVVFEGRAGGRIYERRKDGDVRVWGEVTTWDPPRTVQFSWHPGTDHDEPEHVTVAFEGTSAGTRVTLTHDGWKHLGAGAPAAQDRLETGWEPVLGWLASSTPPPESDGTPS